MFSKRVASMTKVLIFSTSQSVNARLAWLYFLEKISPEERSIQLTCKSMRTALQKEKVGRKKLNVTLNSKMHVDNSYLTTMTKQCYSFSQRHRSFSITTSLRVRLQNIPIPKNCSLDHNLVCSITTRPHWSFHHLMTAFSWTCKLANT
jgi:hypothetical protein